MRRLFLLFEQDNPKLVSLIVAERTAESVADASMTAEEVWRRNALSNYADRLDEKTVEELKQEIRRYLRLRKMEATCDDEDEDEDDAVDGTNDGTEDTAEGLDGEASELQDDNGIIISRKRKFVDKRKTKRSRKQNNNFPKLVISGKREDLVAQLLKETERVLISKAKRSRHSNAVNNYSGNNSSNSNNNNNNNSSGTSSCCISGGGDDKYPEKLVCCGKSDTSAKFESKAPPPLTEINSSKESYIEFSDDSEDSDDDNGTNCDLKPAESIPSLDKALDPTTDSKQANGATVMDDVVFISSDESDDCRLAPTKASSNQKKSSKKSVSKDDTFNESDEEEIDDADNDDDDDEENYDDDEDCSDASSYAEEEEEEWEGASSSNVKPAKKVSRIQSGDYVRAVTPNSSIADRILKTSFGFQRFRIGQRYFWKDV